ncbi:ArsR/SmtB family transcription factor [Primorskyibacter sp. 2E233]|uniref:ArsR/SmtB family transcription factor n=1 Tax=Primorskyibacter sp. 2E233 TaxID=3413431 RepID=UPI003BF2A024
MAKFHPDLDHLFSALGHPTRRMILTRLARGQASVSELAEPHDMALPTFMSHLRRLEQAGLVSSTKTGRVRIYSLTPEALVPAQDWLSAQRALWESRLNQLDDYAITLNKERENGPGPENRPDLYT